MKICDEKKEERCHRGLARARSYQSIQRGLNRILLRTAGVWLWIAFDSVLWRMRMGLSEENSVLATDEVVY